jgi:hypothetical protein
MSFVTILFRVFLSIGVGVRFLYYFESVKFFCAQLVYVHRHHRSLHGCCVVHRRSMFRTPSNVTKRSSLS